MPRRVLAAALLFAVGCGDDAGPGGDASVGVDADDTGDARPPTDGSTPLAWVDFAITGCDPPGQGEASESDSDASAPTCTGTAPLSLRFTAIAPAPVDLHIWTFGDGHGSQEASPMHVYELPGTYDVSITVGGPGGTASLTRQGIVVARAAGLGDGCTLEAQCDTGLSCACDRNGDCGEGLAQGLCVASCAGVSCGDGLCADLDPANSSSPAEWQAALCLVSCEGHQDCAAGTTCQTLRGDDGWIRACFLPGLLAPIGGSCVDAAGVRADSRCSSGHCVDEGLRGLCTATCSDVACPDGSTCATFAHRGPLCVARCDQATDCGDDPWLACEAPGGTGVKSFTVAETPAPGGYCAPRRCEGPEVCGPAGTCTNGYCGAL